MKYELDRFSRELSERLDWLLRELQRLKEENEHLLLENKELREEVTLVRLHTELGTESELPAELRTDLSPEPVLSREALQFYQNLPQKINFADFFSYAEEAELTGSRAREYMLSFFRQGLLEQRGRRLEKSSVEEQPRCRETQGV